MIAASADIMPVMTVLTELFNPATRPVARPRRWPTRRCCGCVRARLAAPAQLVSGITNQPVPSLLLRPRDSHALVARDGFRALDGGAKVE
jgi:hypothetical protein